MILQQETSKKEIGYEQNGKRQVVIEKFTEQSGQSFLGRIIIDGKESFVHDEEDVREWETVILYTEWLNPADNRKLREFLRSFYE